MGRRLATGRVTLLVPIIVASLCGLAGGCSQLLGITDITAGDGAASDDVFASDTSSDLKEDRPVADASTGDRGSGAENYCQRPLWQATASVHGTGLGPIGGIDGDLNTRWNNDQFQNGTDWYQVNFGGPVTLTKIVLNNTQVFADDFPGSYELYASQDGNVFDKSPFITGNGTTVTTAISFPQRTLSAVRIKQVGTSNSAHWWGIDEFQVTCQAATAP